MAGTPTPADQNKITQGIDNWNDKNVVDSEAEPNFDYANIGDAGIDGERHEPMSLPNTLALNDRVVADEATYVPHKTPTIVTPDEDFGF